MRKLNLTGKRFGRLLIIAPASSVKGMSKWCGLCDCGSTGVYYSKLLKRGDTKSCGCLRKELTKKYKTKHGKSGSATFNVWVHMKSRCLCKTNHKYKNYGGRGITICERWMIFENFLEDMGEKPLGKTIDRIDNNKGYCKSNCRWATPSEQANNKTTTIRIKYKGRTLSLKQWSLELNIAYGTLMRRYKKNYSVNKLLTSIS